MVASCHCGEFSAHACRPTNSTQLFKFTVSVCQPWVAGHWEARLSLGALAARGQASAQFHVLLTMRKLWAPKPRRGYASAPSPTLSAGGLSF